MIRHSFAKLPPRDRSTFDALGRRYFLRANLKF
jgi:hypothetical protein